MDVCALYARTNPHRGDGPWHVLSLLVFLLLPGAFCPL